MSIVITFLRYLGQPLTLFQGDKQLSSFLKQCHVVVNCLPLTQETDGLLNSSFFSNMNEGSFLINISRGDIVNEGDLITSLDSNHITAAALDALKEEPLPAASSLWSHPKIHITPHMSGATYANSAAKVISNNIMTIETGGMAFPLYDRNKGY